MAITITITITSKSVIDYTQLQLQLSITPCLIIYAPIYSNIYYIDIMLCDYWKKHRPYRPIASCINSRINWHTSIWPHTSVEGPLSDGEEPLFASFWWWHLIISDWIFFMRYQDWDGYICVYVSNWYLCWAMRGKMLESSQCDAILSTSDIRSIRSDNTTQLPFSSPPLSFAYLRRIRRF